MELRNSHSSMKNEKARLNNTSEVDVTEVDSGLGQILAGYGASLRKTGTRVRGSDSQSSTCADSVSRESVIENIPQAADEAEALCFAANPVQLAHQLSFLKKTREDFKPENSTFDDVLQSGASSVDIAAILESSPWATPLHDENDFDALAVERGVLTIRDMKTIAARCQSEKRPFWQVAVEGGYVTENNFQRIIAGFTGFKRTSGSFTLNRKLLRTVPVEWIQYFSFIPWNDRNGVCVFVATRPPGEAIHQMLESSVRQPVSFEIAEVHQIKEWRQRWMQVLEKSRGSESEIEHQQTFNINVNTNAVQLVDQILQRAVETRASDVHIEPVENGGHIRYRIDGACHHVASIANPLYSEIIARLKVSADMDITERRRPQGGHITYDIKGRSHNLRLATVPATHGEKVAIRLADSQKVITKLDNLGLSERHVNILKDMSARPFGMLLVTGPVGSGKTTTLYSCLHELDRNTLNVMSIEDPVEIHLDGVTQLEVNYNLGFCFIEGLRALLRQDPDAILIGEIRDEETARISTRASMTGLRVFSTLHTNDSIGAINALRHFQISSHIISSSLQGIIAQRLLRRNCIHCTQPYELTSEDREMLHLGRDEELRSMKGTGCNFCRDTGYQGRIGVFEIFQVDNEVREMVLNEASESVIRQYAQKNGLTTLQDDCLGKIRQGLTSVDEYRRTLNF